MADTLYHESAPADRIFPNSSIHRRRRRSADGRIPLPAQRITAS